MIRATNKLYALQRSCDYHYYQYTRPNRTNLFHKERLFNMKSCCCCKFHLQPALCRLARQKERFREGSRCVQRQQRNVQKSVIHVKLFFCFMCYPIAFLLLSLPLPSSLHEPPNKYLLKKTLVLEFAQSLLIRFETVTPSKIYTDANQSET